VIFKGTSGEAGMSGIFFRIVFNSWAGKTNRNDALKSITYTMAVVG
jgi:hypothetical protein